MIDIINLGIYIVPTIALTLVIILFFHFLKSTINRQSYRYLIVTVAIVALILNFIWELAHGPLYRDFLYDWEHISNCALASITDMLTLLLLLFGFGLVYKNIFWIDKFSFSKIILLMLAGGSGSIFLEMWHIDRGDWSYGGSMPLIPIVNVGFSPVLQFTVLPSIIFLISNSVHKLINKNFKNKTGFDRS